MGHAVEDGLSRFDITVFSVFRDLGVAVNEKFAGFSPRIGAEIGF